MTLYSFDFPDLHEQECAGNAGERTMNALVEAEGLTKSFGKLRAVDGITLNVTRGEVLGFLGPNGAGKSTTMRLITGFLEPDSGRARISGFDVHDQAREAKKRLGYLPEGAPFTPSDAARLFALRRRAARLEGAAIGDAIARAVDRTGLGPVLDQTIDTLSKGYKRRVGIAQAILHDPEVLIMDEPTDGLDPNQKHQVRELIAEMAKEKAIIVSTHILEEVEAVCTRAVVINKGRIVADGTAEDLMRRVPYHGAVAMRVAVDKADAVKAPLQPSPHRQRRDVRRGERPSPAPGFTEERRRHRYRCGLRHPPEIAIVDEISSSAASSTKSSDRSPPPTWISPMREAFGTAGSSPSASSPAISPRLSPSCS